mmetsp:Transcript_14829/g.40568  ORF Transcript_14829/g.40568 Transcript_14829/m.40568 type:complete len:139 (-) Transcript_14829:223-639(-)
MRRKTRDASDKVALPAGEDQAHSAHSELARQMRMALTQLRSPTARAATKKQTLYKARATVLPRLPTLALLLGAQSPNRVEKCVRQAAAPQLLAEPLRTRGGRLWRRAASHCAVRCARPQESAKRVLAFCVALGSPLVR